MKSPDSLHTLVRSLSRSEKRYFKLYASMQGSGEKKYIRLFDAIEEMVEYDESALRERFQAESFVRQLHVAKNYLFNLILRSLRAYRAEWSIDARIDSLLQDVEILRDKGLDRESRNALKKARALAERHERLGVMVEILALEHDLLPERTSSLEAIDELRQEERLTTSKIDELNTLGWLSNQISLGLFREGIPRDEDGRDLIDDIMAHPALSLEHPPSSLRASLIYHYIHSSACYMRGDTAGAVHHNGRRIALLESDPEALPHRISAYIASLINQLTLCRHPAEVATLLSKLRSTPRIVGEERGVDERFLYRIFNVSNGLELLHLIRRGEFDQAFGMSGEIDRGFERYERFIHDVDRLRYSFLLAYAAFGVGEHRTALERLQPALDINDPEQRVHVHRAARLLELMLHYELGNMTVIEHRVRSVYRYLKGSGALHRFETILLTYLRRLPNLRNDEEIRRSFAQLHDELAALRDDPNEKHSLDDFPYLTWLRSKIERRDFGEIVREG